MRAKFKAAHAFGMVSIASRKFSATPRSAASLACGASSSASSAVGRHSTSVASSSSENSIGPPLPPVPRMKSFTCSRAPSTSAH